MLTRAELGLQNEPRGVGAPHISRRAFSHTPGKEIRHPFSIFRPHLTVSGANGSFTPPQIPHWNQVGISHRIGNGMGLDVVFQSE